MIKIATPFLTERQPQGATVQFADKFSTKGTIEDSDENRISDATDIIFLGLEWNLDFDNDGLINTLDYDSDTDGVSNGYEISTGIDPSDPTSRKWEVIVLPDSFIIPF